MIALVLYTAQGDGPIVGIAWRETARALMLRTRFSDGPTRNRILKNYTFGRLMAEGGVYAPRTAILVTSLWEAMDLLGRPVEVVQRYPAAQVHVCWRCKLGDCSVE